ncbi:hypothetical protein IV102_17290 [bacterium]|nr:hypothetical protein [bacterium]
MERKRRRIFACPLCDEVFIDEAALRRHHQQSHPDTHQSQGSPLQVLQSLFCRLFGFRA